MIRFDKCDGFHIFLCILSGYTLQLRISSLKFKPSASSFHGLEKQHHCLGSSSPWNDLPNENTNLKSFAILLCFESHLSSIYVDNSVSSLVNILFHFLATPFFIFLVG